MTEQIAADAATVVGEDSQESQTFTAEYVTSLREEAKANRLKYQSLLTEKEQRDADAEAAKAKLLEEQGEFKTLAEQRQAEIEELKVYKEQVQGFIDEATKNNEAFIEQVPEDKRGLIPTHYNPRDLQTYLLTNRDLLLGQDAKPFTPPSTNGGAGTYQKSAPKALSQQEADMARKLGMTAEDYALSKAAIKK